MGLLAGLLKGREAWAVEPASWAGELLIQRWLLSFVGREALIVLALSFVLFGVGVVGLQLGDPEPAVIAACVIMDLYFGHLLLNLIPLAGYARFALRLRLGPRRLLLAALYYAILTGLRRLEVEFKDAAAEQWQTRIAYRLAKWSYQEPQDRIAYHLALAVAPRLWRQALRALALTLAPLLLILISFRVVVTYDLLLDKAAHLNILEALVYPFAAIVDVMIGSSWRDWLKAP